MLLRYCSYVIPAGKRLCFIQPFPYVFWRIKRYIHSETWMLEYFKKFSLHMDYEGQMKAEKIYQLIILIFAAIGFVIGYIYQQFSLTVYTLGIGVLISIIITIIPWPYFRRHPLKWQKVKHDKK